MGLDFGSAWRVDEYDMVAAENSDARWADVRDRPFGWQTALSWWMSDGLERPGAQGLRAGAPKTTHPRETINRARMWVTTMSSPRWL